jgi:hypothetical protein
LTLPVLARQKSNFGRVYVHPLTGEEVPSVTNITGRKDKSGPLVGWAVKHSAARAMQELQTLLALFQDESIPQSVKEAIIKERYGTKKRLGQLEKEIKSARFEEKATESFSASEAGTLIHDLIETHVKEGRLGLSVGTVKMIVDKAGLSEEEAIEEVMPWFRQYLAFEKRFQPVWEQLESTVWNRTLGYAGTMDGLMRLPNGRRYLVDFKTGNGVYPEYGMQLEALARGEVIIDPETGYERPMTQVDSLAVLHLRPEYSKLHEVRRHDFVWEAFLGLLAVKRFDDQSHLILGVEVETRAEDTDA